MGLELSAAARTGATVATAARPETSAAIASAPTESRTRAASDKLELSDRARRSGSVGGRTVPSNADEYSFYQKYMGKDKVQKIADLDERKADLSDERAKLIARIPEAVKRPSDPKDLPAFFEQQLGRDAARRIAAIDAESETLSQQRLGMVREHISASEESKSPQNRSLMDQFFMNLNMKVLERIMEEMKATANS